MISHNDRIYGFSVLGELSKCWTTEKEGKKLIVVCNSFFLTNSFNKIFNFMLT